MSDCRRKGMNLERVRLLDFGCAVNQFLLHWCHITSQFLNTPTCIFAAVSLRGVGKRRKEIRPKSGTEMWQNNVFWFEAAACMQHPVMTVRYKINDSKQLRMLICNPRCLLGNTSSLLTLLTVTAGEIKHKNRPARTNRMIQGQLSVCVSVWDLKKTAAYLSSWQLTLLFSQSHLLLARLTESELE